ncbi:DUF2306 domain-containing protein [Marinicella litoralis]|uniref:Putative membrane protein DUF2306 n=1 Tax=Marinicella litoralis TaxID=644220 RepID=A0A4R6XRX5_9GAMM|nr:DUF2306 domain-containing protein [Marinicella litoralis]TDR22506.1 putative membrane protein DUF2306 [Marinicella litoralis]
MDRKTWAQKTLNVSAVFWFVVTFIGQLIFVVYVFKTFYLSAAQGQWNVWNTQLTHGYVPGMMGSNLASVTHMLLAALIILSGCVQLIPQIRNAFPKFHRWNGRVYLMVAMMMSASGLYLMWTTGTVGDWTLKVGLSLSGLLILVFGFQAYKYARAKKFLIHKRWAIRLFLVVSTVWFFRIGMMLWFFINQGPAGMDPATFTGPFVTFLAFAQWIIPLLLAELYFKAQSSLSGSFKAFVAALLCIVTLLMVIGIAMATIGMWFPS